MRIVSEAECREWLETNVRIGFTRNGVDAEYASRAVYQLPADAGKKTVLARIVSYYAASGQAGLFWITGWGIFPSTDNMPLFNGYRLSLGEKRSLIDAPGHIFSETDLPQLECLYCLALYFDWDSSLFVGPRNVVVKTSHDEYISVHAKDDSLLSQFQSTIEPMELKQFYSARQ